MTTKNNTFDKLFTKLRQASEICKIVELKEVSLKLDSNHKLIYTYLLQLFNSKVKHNHKTFLSIERIASECALSVKTTQRKIKDLRDFGIITYTTKRDNTGLFTTPEYTEVVNLVTSSEFKLKSPQLNLYWKKRDNRKEYLNNLINPEDIPKGLTKEQIRNYTDNRNYEMVTGQYLEGDKMNSKLYKQSNIFTWVDELKDYEFDFIIDTNTGSFKDGD